MKTKTTLTLAFFLCWTSFAFSQSHICGTSHEAFVDNAKRIVENRKSSDMSLFDRTVTTTYVPVAFHLVADENGNGRVQEADVLDALCILNLEFLEANDPIQFYLYDDVFNYVDNSTIYNQEDDLAAAQMLMADMKVEDALNVFVVSFTGANNLTYYASPVGVNDYIVIRSSYLYAESGLAHSVGHFFSLIHPFFGWESSPWASFINGGIPVDSLLPSGIPVETQSGSNCTIAGDMLCSTPPDYLFGFSATDCEFDEQAIDPEGNLVDPMENNMMSFFPSCVDYVFTEEQHEVMLSDLMSPARDYVNPGTLPSMGVIDMDPVLISPMEGEDVDSSVVAFEWTSVPGATHYLLEVDRLPTFSFNPHSVVVTETNAILQNLQEDADYYWRVRPFNQYVTCSAISGSGTFETFPVMPVATSDVNQLTDFVIFPNPTATRNGFYIKAENRTDLNASISVSSIDGIEIFSNDYRVGNSAIKINTNKWASGIYMISIVTELGTVHKKVILE